MKITITDPAILLLPPPGEVEESERQLKEILTQRGRDWMVPLQEDLLQKGLQADLKTVEFEVDLAAGAVVGSVRTTAGKKKIRWSFYLKMAVDGGGRIELLLDAPEVRTRPMS